ncbi:MAG TPA: signal recognition particle-docking protein FtsY [Acidimicrobiia bacterium]|nr:signal recognition particle-docking protein FtsY [Acidimicrobiia bacterium]
MDWLLPTLAIAVLLLLVGGFFFYRQRDEAGSGTTVVKPTIEGRIAKSRTALGQSLRSVFGRGSLDDEFWQSMEEALIGADVGLATATGVVERVRRQKPTDAATARTLLDTELRSVFENVDRRVDLAGDPAVVLVVGVNGSGKTTSIAKLAGRMLADGHQPLLAAADTFRAAADAQLRTWADRVGVPVVGGREGSDPAAVAFDGLSAAKARGHDVVIVDTAGRLHSKQNLMEELRKIRRVLERGGGRITESLLVLDATGGQNGIAQVREFAHAIGLTGIILTKLDGTARGGIVVAVENELGVPVKFIGVGEQVEDLMPFEPEVFVDELLADA